MTKKGWFSTEEYKVEGEVERCKPGKKPLVTWKIAGNWNGIIRMAPVSDGKVDEKSWEVIYEKPPYPEQFDHQYGMTNFMISMNYFP